MKILIIRFSSIGDLVLTTPVLRCLKNQFPDIQIDYCIKKKFAYVLASNPYIDRLVCYDDNLAELMLDLRAQNYSLVLDLQNNLRSLIIGLGLLCPVYKLDKLNLAKWRMVKLKKHLNQLLPHIVSRYIDVANRALGLQDDNQGLDFFINPKNKIDIIQLPTFLQSGFIALTISAAHQTKTLPNAQLLEICLAAPLPIVLLGGPADIPKAQELIRLANESSNTKLQIYNACGSYNLEQSASIIALSKLLISHDTGLMHIGAALKKPIVAVWGNTIPEFGMWPYRTAFQNLQVEGLACRPCSKIGFDKCPKIHFDCMKKQPITQIGWEMMGN